MFSISFNRLENCNPNHGTCPNSELLETVSDFVIDGKVSLTSPLAEFPEFRKFWELRPPINQFMEFAYYTSKIEHFLKKNIFCSIFVLMKVCVPQFGIFSEMKNSKFIFFIFSLVKQWPHGKLWK